jgi:hypothetical protein
METITEDYVSDETFKLLKEKGFDDSCCRFVVESDETYYRGAPTLQMAMKWLREVHKLYINIWADPKDVESNDFDIIFRAQIYNGTSNYGTYEFSTYEEAAEIAIKYCLKHLI